MASADATKENKAPDIFTYMSQILTPEKAVEYLMNSGILPSKMMCKTCDRVMKIQTVSQKVTSDLSRWKCTKCKMCTSVREGTFLKVCTCTISHRR